MPQAWSSEEAPHCSIIGAFWSLWSFAIYQFSRHLLSDEILGRQMSANMSNSGKILLHHSYIQTWDIVPRVMLVFIWCSSCLLALKNTHGQILSTYLYVISLYSSLDLIIFIQHSLGIPSGRWSGVARLGVCPWRRRAKKPRILAGSTDCLGHSWDLRDSDQWPPVPIAIEVKHFESMTRHSKYLKDHETCLKILPFSLRKVDPCRIQNVLRSCWRSGACIAWIYVDSLLFCAGLWINFTLTIDHHIASGFLVSSSMHLEC